MAKKYQVGDIFKETVRWSSKTGQWKLVAPKGIDTFKTRKAAIDFATKMLGHYRLVKEQ